MKDLMTCPSCLGAKRVMGMGMLQGDCPMCKAVGWIEKVEAPIIPIKVRKKRIIKEEDEDVRASTISDTEATQVSS